MTETKLNGLTIHNIDSKETYDALVAAGLIGENDLALVKNDASAFNLGLTGASVGDIVKVKAVDDSGKPTQWVAASNKYELLRTITITESISAVTISTDDQGNTFSLNNAFVYLDQSIGNGIDYKPIYYKDNNEITCNVPNALNSRRESQFESFNDMGIYALYGIWAGEGNGTGNFYKNVTEKSFEPITSITLSFGAAVSQGRIRLWGVKA